MTATVFLFALCSAISIVTALFAWRRRDQRGLRMLAGGMASIALWALLGVLELTATDLSLKLLFTNISNFFSATASILMLFFVLEFFQRDAWLTPRRRAAFWIPALAYLVLSITNPIHGWIWTGFQPGEPGSGITIYHHGPAYYLAAAFQLLLASWMLAILVGEMHTAHRVKKQAAGWLLVSVLAAGLPYIVYLILPGYNLGFDLMPVGLALSGLLISWTVYEDLDSQMQERTRQLAESVKRMEQEIAERQHAEQELHSIQDSLAHRVAEQSRNLSGIYELVLLAGEVEDLPHLLDESLQRICTAMPANAACIHRSEAAGAPLKLIAQCGLSEKQQAASAALPEGWLASGDMPRLLPDLSAKDLPAALGTGELGMLPAALQLPGLASAITAPLSLADEYFGVLTVFWARPGLVSVEHIELFSALVKQITLLVENVRLRQRIESAAAARERRRLARDLHDSVTQSLHSLTFSAYTASNRLRQGRLNDLEESLRNLSDGAGQALKEMRLLLYEMRLAPLESVDLIEALQTRLEAVEKRAGINARLDLLSPPLWPKAWESEIYCIAMEALNNSLKHAHAGQVQVRIGCVSDRFSLEVIDDGRGFEASYPGGPRLEAPGMGLRNMFERVERLGGDLMIDASPNCGTRIVVTCSLPEMEDEKLPHPDRG